jgi:hypothetical protein
MMSWPIAFFHVKKSPEIWQNEISQKRVLLYEPQKADKSAIEAKLADPLREGVMQTVVDNIVRRPKTYNMEIIIPFTQAGVIKRYPLHITTLTNFFSALFGVETSFVQTALSVTMAAADIAGRMVNLLTSIGDSTGLRYLNRNSLEAMFESNHVLTMKMWTGYQYKFVAITNATIDKTPTEDDVFRGTLQLQEMPVLSVTPVTGAASQVLNRNALAALTNWTIGALSALPIAATGVRIASGAEDVGVVPKTIGV